MDLQKLNDEITLPYYDGMETEEIVEALNAQTVQKRKYVITYDAYNHILKAGLWEKLDAATVNVAYPVEFRTALRKFMAMIGSQIPQLNFETEELVYNMAVIVQLQIITQQELDDFNALSIYYVSKAQELFSEPVDLINVKAAFLIEKIDLSNQKINLWQEANMLLNAGVDVDLEGMS